MPEITITLKGVEGLLKGLNPNKASGQVEISPRLLKELHHEIAPILTKIYRSSLSTGIVPNDWKTALVAPVYKKGPKYKPSNYRPISLTCIASKLIEHILVSCIMTHFDSNDLLSPFQHGFRSKHSCETQLVNFTQEMFDNLENGKQADLIIMNFSKAFDKVDHNLLIYKLFNLGVNLNTVSWIKSFLQIDPSQLLLKVNSPHQYLSCQASPSDLYWGPVSFWPLLMTRLTLSKAKLDYLRMTQ